MKGIRLIRLAAVWLFLSAAAPLAGQDAWVSTSTAAAPTARAVHTAVWTGTRMIVWGGCLGPGLDSRCTSVTNTGGVYDPVGNTWTAMTTTGAPTARFDHTAVWTGTRMIVWGGRDAAGVRTNTGGVYDPVANSWTAATTTGAPTGSAETAVWTGTKMIVWGGTVGTTGFNTGGQYDPVADSWTATTTTGAPAARGGATAVWTGTRMIVWGGEDPTFSLMNTGGQYDPVGNTWTAATTTGAPTARREHTAVWTGTKMIVYGGCSVQSPSGSCSSSTNTGGVYDPAANSWTATQTTGAPTGDIGHTAVWTGTKMIVWGGFDPAQAAVYNTGGQYDPAGNSWTATTTTGAPTARAAHTAVWTGTRMIVWGGFDGTTFFNTGGQWGLPPASPAISPLGNPAGPVTGIDFLSLSWGAPVGGTPPTSYDWAINGDPFSASTPQTSATAQPRNSNDPITLHVRARAGSPESPGLAADSPIYSPAPPQARFTAAVSGLTLTVTDTSSPQATAWLWLWGDGNFSTTQAATHTYSTPGTYPVVLVATNGAGSTSSSQQQTLQSASAPLRVLSLRAFDASDHYRQRLTEVRLGRGTTWLAISTEEQEETIVYLRFLDGHGNLAEERRLSVLPDQSAFYDLGAYGLEGTYTLELASSRSFTPSLIELAPPKGRTRGEQNDRE